MKVLVVGDLHFKASNKLCEKFITEFDCKGYDACILLGDIFHTHEKIAESCLNMVVRLFYKITKNCPLYVIVGNHDYKDSQQFLSDRHALVAFKEWKNVTVIDKPQIVEINSHKFTMCPYVTKGLFREAIDHVDWKSTEMIFCHQEFLGVKMGSITSIDGDPWKTSYPPVVSGHIHDRQKLLNGVYYPGVPYDHGYGYNGKRVITSIEFFDEKSYKMKSIEMNLPRNKMLCMTVDEAKNMEFSKNDQYKVVLQCTKTEYIDFCKSVKHKNVIFTYNKIEVDVPKSNDKKFVSYRDIFNKLVENENSFVKNLYKQIIS